MLTPQKEGLEHSFFGCFSPADMLAVNGRAKANFSR